MYTHVGLGAVITTLAIVGCTWRHPGINWEGQRTPHAAIFNDPHRKEMCVVSMDNSIYTTYVTNSAPDSINPYFPTIYATTHSDANAWIQIVRTDSLIPSLRVFVDTVPGHSIYPFYQQEATGAFLDTPVWPYIVLLRPFTWTWWQAHLYAVHVDAATNTITPRAGMSWGFQLPYTESTPRMLHPEALTYDDWHIDWTLFTQLAPEYSSSV